MEHKQTTSFLDEFALEKRSVLSGHYMKLVIPVTFNHLVLSGNRRTINHPPVKNSNQFQPVPEEGQKKLLIFLETEGRICLDSLA